MEAVQFSAALNGVSDRVVVCGGSMTFPRSNGELFDQVIATPPSLPAPECAGGRLWDAAGAEGTTWIRALLNHLPSWMASSGEALVACHALGGATFISLNRDVLPDLCRDHRLEILAFVLQKMPLESFSKRMESSVARAGVSLDTRTTSIAEWHRALKDHYGGTAYVYMQVLRMRRTEDAPAMHYVPTYDVGATDRLALAIGA